MTEKPGPLAERFAAWREANPLPASTGQAADKAFFDWLCGEEEREAISLNRPSAIAPPKAEKKM